MVSIIIINYNNYRDTIDCLESLLRIDYQPVQVVLIDNNSRNDSVEQIQRWAKGAYVRQSAAGGPLGKLVDFPILKPVDIFQYHYDGRFFKELDIREGGKSLKSSPTDRPRNIVLIRTVKNLGFAGANNAGILFSLERCAPDYFWFLNNDTVVTSQALQSLLTTINSGPRIGAAGSKIFSYYQPDRLQFLAGGEIGWSSVIAPEEGKHDSATGDRELTGYITGSSFFIKSAILRTVGLWDDRFFMNVEDVEFSWRIKQRGYRLFLASQSIVYHKGGASTHQKVERRVFLGKRTNRYSFESCIIPNYYNIRNWIYFNKKNRGILFNLVYLVLYLPYYVLGIGMFILALDDHKLERMMMIAAAVIDGLRDNMGERKSPGPFVLRRKMSLIKNIAVK